LTAFVAFSTVMITSLKLLILCDLSQRSSISRFHAIQPTNCCMLSGLHLVRWCMSVSYIARNWSWELGRGG